MRKEEHVKDSFLQAAEKLFQKWGINKTTMDDIAREAGKSKSSIYYYYRNKEAILEAVAMVQADRITAKVGKEVARKETAKEKLLAYVYTTFSETRRAVTLYELAKGEMRANQDLIQNVMDKYYAAQEDMIEGILRQGDEEKEFRSIGGHDIKDTTRAIITIMRSLILDIFIKNDDKKLIDLVIELLAEGL